MPKKKIKWKKEIDVLGQKYTIYFQRWGNSFERMHCDGWTDWSKKVIKVCDTGNQFYDHKVMRHEIIHAFAFESGFNGCQNARSADQPHDEQIVDWVAVQSPKFLKIFEELNILG